MLWDLDGINPERADLRLVVSSHCNKIVPLDDSSIVTRTLIDDRLPTSDRGGDGHPRPLQLLQFLLLRRGLVGSDQTSDDEDQRPGNHYEPPLLHQYLPQRSAHRREGTQGRVGYYAASRVRCSDGSDTAFNPDLLVSQPPSSAKPTSSGRRTVA